MELPKFVELDGVALRLIGDYYYRDGGEWTVGYKIIDDELLSWYPNMGHNNLHRKPLKEITEKKWRKSNGKYATKL